MLPRLIKSTLILFAVFAVVWVATIAWWQSINRMPTTTDIVTHLVLMPAGMVAAYLVIKRALDGIRTNVAAASQAPPTPAPGAASDAADGAHPESGDPTRTWRAALLATAVRAPAGNAPDTLAEAAKAGNRPGLVALDGLPAPVFAAQVESLDIDSLRTEFAARTPDLAWDDEALRALALAGEVTDELAMQAAIYAPAGFDMAVPESAAPLVATMLLPRGWPESRQAAAGDWLRERLSQYWPAARLTLEATAARGDGDALLLLDRATQAVNRPVDGVPALRMLVAADSLIGANTVEALEQEDQLFSARCPHGRTPGEAAAGVLLGAHQGATGTAETGTDGTADAAADSAPILITRTAMARLDAPTPDRGLPQLEALAQAVSQAIETIAGKAEPAPEGEAATAGQADAAPAAVATIVTDTGVHPVRTVEVAQVVSTRFPSLDPVADLLALGLPCGYAGAAGALLPVVVAHHLALDGGRPVLALSAGDAQQRGAVAILPA
ncbi:hypothetical protein QO239_05655 [Cupriavidus taiwanensis]|uniref:hypothetical protein n=1 Tax=Cupriavidus taiwanensis TaxID=164546 RepID=UPI0025408E6C|nr:hypothetical protein [Cupriavidus taiwanensis]MDK3022091.1 hypothetical protein [Cupriavidus taiwanensis]